MTIEQLRAIEDDLRTKVLDNLENLEYKLAAKFIIRSIPVIELPKSVNIRSVFVVDVGEFPLNDIKSDDNGSWRNNGNFFRYFQRINKSENGVDSFELIKCKEEESSYKVSKTFFYSKANRNFHRKIFRVESTNYEERIDKCLVGYFWVGSEENELKLYSHGNSKSNTKPYIRNSETALKEVHCVFFLTYLQYGV